MRSVLNKLHSNNTNGLANNEPPKSSSPSAFSEFILSPKALLRSASVSSQRQQSRVGLTFSKWNAIRNRRQSTDSLTSTKTTLTPPLDGVEIIDQELTPSSSSLEILNAARQKLWPKVAYLLSDRADSDLACQFRHFVSKSIDRCKQCDVRNCDQLTLFDWLVRKNQCDLNNNIGVPVSDRIVVCITTLTADAVAKHIVDSCWLDFRASQRYMSVRGRCLVGRQLSVADILFDDHFLPVFVEFLSHKASSQGGAIHNDCALVDFLLAALAYRDLSAADSADDMGVVLSDALSVYERFVSMEAVCPIGTPDLIRVAIEDALSSSDGHRLLTAFDPLILLSCQILTDRHLAPFMASEAASAQLETMAADAAVLCFCPSADRHDDDCQMTTDPTWIARQLADKVAYDVLAQSSTARSAAMMTTSSQSPSRIALRDPGNNLNVGRVDELGRYASTLDVVVKQSIAVTPTSSINVNVAVTRHGGNLNDVRSAWSTAGSVVTEIRNLISNSL